MLYSLLKPLVLFVFKIFFYFERHGKNFVPGKGGFILASNHLSLLDPVALGGASPRKLTFMAKDELFENKLFSLLIKSLGAFPVKRQAGDTRAIKTAINIVSEGRALVIFPQGTRTSKREDGVKGGLGFIVKRSGVPVVCCRIYGSDAILPSGVKKINLFKKLKVSFSEPLHFDKRDSAHKITEKVLHTIYSL